MAFMETWDIFSKYYIIYQDMHNMYYIYIIKKLLLLIDRYMIMTYII